MTFIINYFYINQIIMTGSPDGPGGWANRSLNLFSKSWKTMLNVD